MRLPPADLIHLRDQFCDLASRVGEQWEISASTGATVEPPGQLGEAMRQLVDVLRQIAENAPSAPDRSEVHTLGEYGLHLMDELADRARHLGLDDVVTNTESLAFAFGLWLARNDGEIRNLGAIVSAAVRFAGIANQPPMYASLYVCCNELIEAASPTCEQQGQSEGRQPWRQLLCCRASVAMHSCNVEFMTTAFDALVEHLPDVAHEFFAEGMEQVTIVDFPDSAREVMRRYYLANATPQNLH